MALIAVLVLFNAAFAGSELAVVSLRPAQLRRLRSDHGIAGARVADLAAEPSRFLSTVQVGITLGGFLASAAAAVSLAQPLERVIGFLGSAAAPVSVIAVTLALTFVTLVFGELVPKRIALQRAEGWSLRAARPLTALARVAAPAVTLLSWTTDAVIRLLGLRADSTAAETTEEELRDLIAHQPGVSTTRRAMLTGAFELDDRVARDILVPRRDVQWLLPDAPVEQAIRSLVETGHSRAPLLDDDALERVVHLRDLVNPENAGKNVDQLARAALVVPETVSVLELLRLLQAGRQQMALVANEYGTVEGIVTVEDVLEEIVGEIYDEFDRDLNEADARSVVRAPDGSLTVPGGFPVHDLPDVGLDLPATGQTTIAGLVIEQLMRIPESGEEVVIGEWRITVVEVANNAITRLTLRRMT